jgi:hypothetical protein
MLAPQSRLAYICSGRWDHVLPRDIAGRIFLDLDEKWVKPILQHLYNQSLAHDSNEPLDTPESSFEDNDDLIGYHAAVDFLGLTETFYPAKPVQMPLGFIDPQHFIQKLQPTVQAEGCDWRAHWTMLYKSSRDGYDLQAYKDCCKDKDNTMVFIKQRGTNNVYGGYSAYARQYPTAVACITKEDDPDMFIFAITGAADTSVEAIAQSQYTKFTAKPNSSTLESFSGYDSQLKAFELGDDDLSCKMASTSSQRVLSKFRNVLKGEWQYNGLASTNYFTADEIEVWQIPSMTADSDTSPIIDTTIDPICTLPIVSTARCSSVMTFRDDVSALVTPVTDLDSGWQTWLLKKLRQ